MGENSTKVYHAAIYLRLSKEDGDIVDKNKEESNSISNQKELIMTFLKSKPDIEVVSVRADDGYSGVNFNRPEFQKMLEDIKKGAIDCVVVKDLSRFGRNYIDAGKFIEKIFPALGIRFIAINDNYDSSEDAAANHLIIPFKNLINDAYCRDISIKIRSHLEVKRRKGEYTGAFAVYGYLKSEDNKNKLVVDDYAAAVVRDIFRYKLEGYSQQNIANKLNAEGILSPMEYKRSLGMNYTTPFKTNARAQWGAVSISRILKNEVYIGSMVQGKHSTPNYKVKKSFLKREEEWVRVENVHEAIILKADFERVQEILMRDTRTSPDHEKVRPLAGLLFCGDCGSPMGRKTVPVNGKKYHYYVCVENRKNKTCSSHCISEEKMDKAVLNAIRMQIGQTLDTEQVWQKAKEIPAGNRGAQKYEQRINSKKSELHKAERLKVSAYEDMKEGLITLKEYQELKEEFESRAAEDRRVIKNYEDQMAEAGGAGAEDRTGRYLLYKKPETLTRPLAVTLIDKIFVYEKGRLEVVFRFEDEFKKAMPRKPDDRRRYEWLENPGSI